MNREVARAGLVLALGLLLWAARPPSREGPPVWGAPPDGAAGLLFGRRLDPNRAGPLDFQALPGIGPGRAAAIVAARRKAPFCRVADLVRVRGIGPKTLARIAPLLAVREEPRCTRAFDPRSRGAVE